MLTILDLQNNRIRAKGAQHMAHALEFNTVRKIFFAFPLSISQYNLIQTLVQLELRGNRIGIEGTRYLAEVLEKNTVKMKFSVFLLYLLRAIHKSLDAL